MDIEKELEMMKYISSGTVFLSSGELEFTTKLGQGVAGTVYRGLYRGKEVAIKVLKTEQTSKEMDEFKKEFQVMSAIQSPYIVFFFGACISPKLCMVMELCENQSLYHVLNKKELDIGWERFFEWTAQMTKGMECLHAWKPTIVHRDFKSLNLMVNSAYQVKVGDFGLSRFNTETQMDTLNKLRGTFAYCAPEVYFGKPFSTKSDVYSIALVIWEIVCRLIIGEYQRPYGEFPHLKFDFQIIIQTAKQKLRPTIPKDCPPSIVEVITTLWNEEPDVRPDCTQLISTLEDIEKTYEKNKIDWNKLLTKPATN